MRAIRLKIPQNVKRGEVVELKARINHDMESGYRLDSYGKRIARNILTHFECRLEGRSIFKAEFGPGVAANPLISFYIRAENSGELEFRWTEQSGDVFVKTTQFDVN